MGNWEAGFEGPDPVSQTVKSPQTFQNSLEGGSELEKCASHSLLIHLPPNPNFLAGQSTTVIFKLLRPPCVPSLTSPHMTLLETVTGRLTPDAFGQGARSPHPQITRGRRWPSNQIIGCGFRPNSGEGRLAPAGRERCRQAGATPGAGMWIARSRGAPREGLPLLNIYLRPVPRTHAAPSSRLILSRSPWE